MAEYPDGTRDCPRCLARGRHPLACACLGEMELFMRRHLAFADYLVERLGPDELLAA